MKPRTICTTCVAIFISFPFHLTCIQFTLFLQHIDSDLGNMNKIQSYHKEKIQMVKVYASFYVAQKTKFKGLQIKVLLK
jgi:hypothetical protein